MCRSASGAVQLSIFPSPIESTIAARFFRSIAFLVASVGCVALSLGGASALAQGLPPSEPPPPAPTPSIVYRAHDPAAIRDYRTNPALVRQMVSQLVCAV